MLNILCFGDSNTWGYVPEKGLRYDENTRWTAIAQSLLGEQFRIHEAGLNGRTIMQGEANREFRNGAELLNLYLESCRPLDMVIIMLGTNDLKASFDLSINTITQAARALCQQVLEFDYAPYHCPKLMLIAPAPLVASENIDSEFENRIADSKRLAPAYYQLCNELNIDFVDAGRIVKASIIDGVHWDKDGHHNFGQHLSTLLQQLSEK
ncbi:MAG: SGNH/GDSL hydrolase family protein [Colwellia sp.]|nr:SGNH/GDSL hydrolase family protein [Colwellia sp.]